MFKKVCQFSVTMLVIINFCMEFKANASNDSIKWTYFLINRGFSIVVNLSVVVAIDPEYEILNRIRQVDQAIVNALGYFKNSENNSITTENNDVSFWCSHRWVYVWCCIK